jgi:stearoyl-CoA desaturase (delta-9 desaturase)
MPKWVEKFFFVFSFIAQGSSYMSPKVYGALHRLHHIHADTEEDPHSPKYSSNFVKLMVKTYHKFAGIQSGNIEIDDNISQNLPDWKWFDKVAGSLLVKILWGLFYVYFYYLFATEWWMYLFIPAHIVMGPIHGTIVNWFAHKIGYTNYNVEILLKT